MPIDPSVFVVGVVACGLLIFLAFNWPELGLGQRVYALFGVGVISLAYVIAPFEHPENKTTHWSFAWAPPTYVDEEMNKIMTPELMEEIEKTGAVVSDDFIENTTTRPMSRRYRYYRRVPFLVICCVVMLGIGWPYVPAMIENLATSLLNKRPAR